MNNTQELIFIYGPMCSGKSTLANNLAKHSTWSVVDSDEVMTRIHPDSDYGDSDREDMYVQTFKEAVSLHNSGKPVIVSCAFTNDKYITMLKDAGLFEKITTSILLQVSPDIAVERWLVRNNNPKIQTQDIVYKYASKDFPMLPNQITVNADNQPNVVLTSVLECIS